MAGRLRTSSAGLQLIKSFEGFRGTAAQLPDGRWTIGYGHVRTAREGLTINEKDAEDLLVYDLKPIEEAVSTSIFAPLMQNQFDALVSLVFNISPRQFRDSEIARFLNGGDYLAAANAFDLWRKARLHGRVMVVDALVRRRAAEKSMFLDHPSGPPSAPTPIVRPEMDTGERTARTVAESLGQPPPYVPEEGEDDTYAPPPASGSARAPSSDIAEAVRRLAERTMEAITPAPEIPLPLGAQVEHAAFAAEATSPAAPEIVEPQPVPAEASAAPARSMEDVERASLDIADRVRNILARAEREISSAEAANMNEPAGPAAPAMETQRPAAAATRAERVVRPVDVIVREGLPDFDEPAEPAARALANGRRLIDDTETFDPGLKPEVIFAEAERKAKVVNGHARRVGPISGRLLMQAPWLVMLALSAVGFVFGLFEAFGRAGADAGSSRVAMIVIAVFGMMLLLSVYYLFWDRGRREDA